MQAENGTSTIFFVSFERHCERGLAGLLSEKDLDFCAIEQVLDRPLLDDETGQLTVRRQPRPVYYQAYPIA